MSTETHALPTLLQSESDTRKEDSAPDLKRRSLEATPHRRLRRKQADPAHRPVHLADVAKERSSPICLQWQTLGNACDALAAAGRTAALVQDAQAAVCGVVTENDVLTALTQHESRDRKLGEWLQDECSRLPRSMLKAVTLPFDAGLHQAAKVMASLAESDAGFACHHVLVTSEQKTPYLVSALDVMYGLVLAKDAHDKGFSGNESAAAVANLQVSQAMKDRADAATCELSDRLEKAFDVMFKSGQNCCLAVAGYGQGEGLDSSHGQTSHTAGVITTSDVLKACSEPFSGVHTTVFGWLQSTMLQRSVLASASLAEAASIMTETGMHHLLVVKAGSEQVVGVLSALDIVCALEGFYDHTQVDEAISK